MLEEQHFKPKIVMTKIGELKKSQTQARKHSNQKVETLKKWIEKTGHIAAIVVNQNKEIVAGYCRYLAAKALGLKEVPVVEFAHLTEEELRAYAIADNALTLDAEWDMEALKIEFVNLVKADFDLNMLSFEMPKIDMILQEPTQSKSNEPDKADELPGDSEIEALVRDGDIWQLGEHRLICANSLQEQTYEALLGDLKADMIFTDVPFNVKVNGHVCGKGKIKHPEFAMGSGEMSDPDYTKFLRTTMKNIVKYSKPGSIHYQCIDWKHCKNMLDAAEGIYTELKNICIWNKGTGGMGSLYRSQHELILVFKNGKAKHINNIQLGRFGRNRTNVWDYPGVRASNPDSLNDLRLHLTVKNLQLVADAILDCSNPNGVILDAFGGSGTTLLAAEKTNRRAFLVEIDPHYCDIILHRYSKMFQKKPEFIANIKGDPNV